MSNGAARMTMMDAPLPRAQAGRLGWLRAAEGYALRIAIGVAGVMMASLILAWADARLEFAAVALLLVVVGAGLLGYAAGLISAGLSFFLLLYFFTPPIGSVVPRDVEDLLVGIAFLVGALVTSLVVARLNELRRRSLRNARETEIRLLLTDRLLQSVLPSLLLRDVGLGLVEVFGLGWCRIEADGEAVLVNGAGATRWRRDDAPVTITSGAVSMTVSGGRRITADDRAMLEALAASLALGLDRMRLETEARDSQVDAELARSRAAFLAAVTHDLRTPLSTIKAATAALMVPGSPLTADERAELLEVANADASELDDLITKVLELANIRSGPVLPKRRELTAEDVVQAALRRARRTVADRSVAVSAPNDIPVLHADLVMLEHALANLIENAAFYAPSEEPIEVDAVRVDDRLQFRVIDHGPGVPEEDRQRVFDEFVRVGPETRRGFGLGLTIVKVLAAAHNGRVWCDETPGGGATFVIEMPFDGAADA